MSEKLVVICGASRQSFYVVLGNCLRPKKESGCYTYFRTFIVMMLPLEYYLTI